MAAASAVRNVHDHTPDSRTTLLETIPVPRTWYHGGRGVRWIWNQTLLACWLAATLFLWVVLPPLPIHPFLALFVAPLQGAAVVTLGLYGYARRRLPLKDGRTDVIGAITRIQRRTLLRQRWPRACEATHLTDARGRKIPKLKRLRPTHGGGFTAVIDTSKAGVPDSTVATAIADLTGLLKCRLMTAEVITPGLHRLHFHWTIPTVAAPTDPFTELPVAPTALYEVQLDRMPPMLTATTEPATTAVALPSSDRSRHVINRDQLADRARASSWNANVNRLRQSGATAMPHVADAAKTGARLSWPWFLAFFRGTTVATRSSLKWGRARAKTQRKQVLNGLLVLMVAPVVAWYAMPGYAVAITVVVAVAALTWLGTRADGPGSWWTERRLVKAFTDAGILTRTKVDQPPHRLGRLGRPVHDQHGTTVVVRMPPGMTVAQVQAKRDALAGALNFPAASFIVSEVEEAPPNVVRLWAAVKSGAHAMTRDPDVVTAERTDWHTPVRIGQTAQGTPVMIGTFEHNVIVAGQMGYGKTSVARILMLHAMLDPTSRIWLINGKGSTRDYADASSLCERVVLGTDDNAPAAVIELLTDLNDEIDRRHTASADMPDDYRYGGLVLIADEIQEVRLAAKALQRDAIDELLKRITSKGRGVGGWLIPITQRPTKDMLPTHVKALIDHQVMLRVRNPMEASYVLANAPAFPLPKKVGRAIVGLPGEDVQATLDYLTNDAWRAGCKRATELRQHQPTVTVTVVPEPSTVALPATPVVPPLLRAVRDVLAATDDHALSPAKLWAALPGDVRPTSAETLGRTLTKHGVPSRMVRKARVRVLDDVELAIKELSR